MTRGLPAALAAAVLGLLGCGEGGTTAEPTTTAPTSTLAEPTTTTSDPCFKFPVLVLRLQNDYRQELRGVAGADPAKYRARAQALVDEAHSLGCPTPVGLNSFLR